MRLFVYRKDKIDVKSYKELGKSLKVRNYTSALSFKYMKPFIPCTCMSVFHIRSIPGEHSKQRSSTQPHMTCCSKAKVRNPCILFSINKGHSSSIADTMFPCIAFDDI